MVGVDVGGGWVGVALGVMSGGVVLEEIVFGMLHAARKTIRTNTQFTFFIFLLSSFFSIDVNS
jgi:hypothetical protein